MFFYGNFASLSDEIKNPKAKDEKEAVVYISDDMPPNPMDDFGFTAPILGRARCKASRPVFFGLCSRLPKGAFWRKIQV